MTEKYVFTWEQKERMSRAAKKRWARKKAQKEQTKCNDSKLSTK